ncbi:MAG: DUF368 domain-containing protein [Marinobacter sp.]|nr:DUF368 domain-containing protein [Marinobacter sp.]
MSEAAKRSQRLPGVFARGLAMGAADIVPGVSGGTIAFITGIYFRLLAAISAVPGAIARQLIKGKVRSFWQTVDGSFLAVLFLGVLTSVFSLAAVISYALTHYPVPLWSFFFGLILAAVWHVGRELRKRQLWQLLPAALGCAFAVWITGLSPAALDPGYMMLFLGGAVAICAMILPGISGSFILVIMGLYAPVLAAIRDLQLLSLTVFAAGCAVGLLSIARLLTWAIHRYHDLVLALLVGIMLGSLNKVWPWKIVEQWRESADGTLIPLVERNVMPGVYTELSGIDNLLPWALLCGLLGLLLVLTLEWLGDWIASRRQVMRSH